MNQANTPLTQSSGPQPPEGKPPPSSLSLEIVDGGLRAVLSGAAPKGTTQDRIKELVLGLLADRQVKYGVLAQGVVEAVKRLAQGETLAGTVIAQGSAPEPGQDAAIEVLVDLESHRIGRILEDGRIDFRDKGPLPIVNPGTRLAVLKPAVAGKPGLDVQGKKILPPMPRQLKLRGGAGVRIEEEGLAAVTTAQGMANQPEEGKFEVLEVLDLAGDVDFASGHVDFPGKVRVAGAILSDFKVQAKSLEAAEMEPGSSVEISGDLTVRGGIMGARVKVGGKVAARFVRDTQLSCEGDLVVESEIVHSRVQCGGRVRISQGDGRIVNSKVHAIRGVITGDIISSGAEYTTIRLGVTAEFAQEMQRIRMVLKDLASKKLQLETETEAKKEELKATEDDLRNMLAAIKDPAQQVQRENLMGQLEMLKPLREGLKNELSGLLRRLADIEFERQGLEAKKAEMDTVVPPGAVWLDVRGSAHPTTEIISPRASMVLSSLKQSFSASEFEAKDEKTGAAKPVIALRRLRSSAS